MNTSLATVEAGENDSDDGLCDSVSDEYDEGNDAWDVDLTESSSPVSSQLSEVRARNQIRNGPLQ